MTQIVPLTHEKHGNLRLREQRDFSDHKKTNFVPVVFQEFSALATEFPLVFVRNKKTGDFVPSAIMGLDRETNLYCQTSTWEPTFIPTSFTLAPLVVTQLGLDGEEPVIAIDEESSLLSDTIGEKLFDADGEASKYLKMKIENVVKVTEQSIQALEICRYMAEKQLLTSRTLKLQYSEESQKYEVEGVFVIDEQVLKSLPDQQFKELHQRGLLAMIYAHLVSLQQVHRLSRMQHQYDFAKLKA